ncbi:hypothetical protein HPB50_026370 [Hyalomma asiaticum]|uniref:Uncharacterized protein n=1 Tax=Hyalomma asiaticum TaxID=266040 RepID=A0ACB7TR14_HYAAI|nr:hypothetical protein HPB50_026370 [Hyalomma asiaticum]
MPYALTFPVYEPDAPLSAKYNALGSVVSTIANGSWTGATEDKLNHEMFASAEVTWKANRDTEYIESAPEMRGDRLFFFIRCYLQCGDRFGEDACKWPLMHSLAFAEAHQCAKGTPMRKDWPCALLDGAE